MNSNDIKNSSFYYEAYSKIEEMKKDFPVNHGFVHVDHVVSFCDKLSFCFNLNKHEKELLVTAALLHDIGYLNGRDNHAHNSGVLAKEYLTSTHNYTDEDIEIICSTISHHGGKTEGDYSSLLDVCIILADKLDFIASRYNNDLEKYPDVRAFLEVKDVEFRVDKSLKINIIMNSLNYINDDRFLRYLNKLDFVFDMIYKTHNIKVEKSFVTCSAS